MTVDKFDFSGIDIEGIDPDRVITGTSQQDCSLIAQTYERATHSIPSEAAVFSTLTRPNQNNKNFALTASASLKPYLEAPQDSSNTTSEQAQRFASAAVPDVGGAAGTSFQSDHIMQGFSVGSQKQPVNTDSFGDKLLNWTRDCIPCNLRLFSFLELHPNIELIVTFENYLQNALDQLSGITSLLNDVDIYGDFCSLMNLLSFMCIPDLQRIISLLMAQFILQVPKLDGLIGMLQALIAPIFAPILISITALLDQYSVVVTNPLKCVVDAINQQLEKLNIEAGDSSFSVEQIPTDQINQLSGGLQQLNVQVQEGIQVIQEKLDFYISQIKAFFGEVGSNDTAYLQGKLKSLQLVRMISFVVAIIQAISKGHAACSSNKTPEAQELDNFFNNFLNPNGAFNLYIDNQGQIVIDEKVDEFVNIVNSPTASSNENVNPGFSNVLSFEGEDVLDPIVLDQVETISAQLSQPIRVSAQPCKLETSSSEVEQVNQWISELNRNT